MALKLLCIRQLFNIRTSSWLVTDLSFNQWLWILDQCSTWQLCRDRGSGGYQVQIWIIIYTKSIKRARSYPYGIGLSLDKVNLVKGIIFDLGIYFILSMLVLQMLPTCNGVTHFCFPCAHALTACSSGWGYRILEVGYLCVRRGESGYSCMPR